MILSILAYLAHFAQFYFPSIFSAINSVLNGLLLSKVFHDPISTMEKGNKLDQNNAMHVLFSKLEVSQKAMMDGKTIE